MAKLRLENLNKLYDHQVHAVKDVNLVIEDKEFVVLVGPSGCGKSTILRMIAGLEEISSGNIYIGETQVNDMLPKDRDIAMVFQNYALYPHMTVYDNLAFCLKTRKIRKDEIRKRVEETAQTLEIGELLQRKPKQLSGGQKQRVALGRAIMRNPRVFLMDEPLSNLDAKLRVQMRAEIHRLYQKLNTTVVYVTHDQTEAMTMGSKIVVLKDGAIQQVDSPQNIYHKPRNLFVAGFIGTPPMNLIEAEIRQNGREPYVRIEEVCLPLSEEQKTAFQSGGCMGKTVIVGIRAEALTLFPTEQGTGFLAGEVEVIENLGSDLNVYIRTSSGSLVTRVHANETISRGGLVRLYFDPEKIHIFDAASGVRFDTASNE